MAQGVVLIAGPTASGKSAVAMRLAQALGGVVINADSMQVYREFRVLTARPSAADEARLPHRLYGFLPVSDPCSVGRWQALAEAEIAAAHGAGRLPVVVGGTGLYLTALTEGLAAIPAVPDEVRAGLRLRLRRDGLAALAGELARRDPEMAARLPAGDRQRILRALEVLEATGESLALWQRRRGLPGLSMPWCGVVLDLPRATLYRRCDARFDAMLAAGALAEVEATMTEDPELPAMKALGVPELRRYLRGESDRSAAVAAAQGATRRYAKRQQTWLRRKMISWNWIQEQDSTSFSDRIMPIVRQFLLTL